MIESVKRVLCFFHINLSERKIRTLIQLVKFGIVGVSNTAISYFINVVVLIVMRPLAVGWDWLIGNIVSFVLSVLWSFYWNNRYVFTLEDGEKRHFGKALMKTYVSYGFTGIVLNNILAYIWINIIGISKFIAPLISLIVSVPLNFIINKLWAFKSEE